ncbi:hypothetical protein OAT93_01580 [bacterium]|nr:hypothetical protein [bacterium]
MKTRKEIKDQIKGINEAIAGNKKDLENIFITIADENEIYMDNDILLAVKKALEWTLK